MRARRTRCDDVSRGELRTNAVNLGACRTRGAPLDIAAPRINSTATRRLLLPCPTAAGSELGDTWIMTSAGKSRDYVGFRSSSRPLADCVLTGREKSVVA